MRRKTAVIILTAAVIILGYWWYVLLWQTLSSEENPLRVHFIDVGQGDAILLETPNRYQILIDAGRGLSVLNALDDLLPTNDRDIDIAVLTHPDTDHIGGFVPIFRRYTVGTVFQTPTIAETSVYRQVVEAIEKEKATTHTVQQPLSFSLDGVRIDMLWPQGTEITETNAASIVLLITYGSTEILLTGDVSVKVEEFLIAQFPERLNDIDLLKAGHHGSKTSTAAAFLNHTKPNAIIYSAGKNNRYGHPHDIVLSRVKTYAEAHPAENLTEHHTADGTVSFCITPTQFAVCE